MTIIGGQPSAQPLDHLVAVSSPLLLLLDVLRDDPADAPVQVYIGLLYPAFTSGLAARRIPLVWEHLVAVQD